LVVGGGFWWRNNQKGEKEVVSKEVVSGNKIEIVEDEGVSDEGGSEEETEAELVSEEEIDTSDWKSFQSSEFNIAFKYPPSWNVSTTLRDNTIVLVKDADLQIGSRENAVLEIINNYWEHGIMDMSLTEKREVEIDGVTTTLSQFQLDFMDAVGLLLINIEDKQNRRHGIEFQPSFFGEAENDIRIFEKIISSIKFI